MTGGRKKEKEKEKNKAIGNGTMATSRLHILAKGKIERSQVA